jgi:Mrp family chromosome partitioning ATPase
MDFDAVIVDSPPVLAVHDAGILAQHVDTTIMVVRWGRTKTATFVTALQRMSDLNIAVKGIVLSMADSNTYGLYDYPDAEIFSCGLRKYYSDG